MSKKRPVESDGEDDDLDDRSKGNSNEDDEDDELDDEEDDDDYSDESYGNNAKKSKKKFKRLGKRNHRKNRFIADEAEEDSEEEEDDDIGSEDPQERRGAANFPVNIPGPSGSRRPGFMNVKEDEIEGYLSNKYMGQGYDDSEEEEESGYMLPSMSDPKIFTVRCMFGLERETVVSLMNKFLYYEEQGRSQLLIYSVTTNDRFPGKIFIEADNEAHVRHAIKDMNNVTFKGNHRIKIVPIKEVPAIFAEDESKNYEFNRGQFVRIKSHNLYKGDLAKVLNVDMTRYRVEVLIVPRISKEELMQMRDDEAKVSYKGRSKPTPKLLPEEELKNSGIRNISSRRDKTNNTYTTVINDKLHFTREGFLRKNFNVKRLQTKDIVPTYEELDLFLKAETSEKDKREVKDRIINMVGEGKDKINIFSKGDKIIVAEGDLKNNIGIVINTSNNEVVVSLDRAEIFEPMTFSPSSLVKYFKEGESVLVVEGEHKGFTGLVVRIEGKLASIVSPTTNANIQTLTNNLKLAGTGSTEIDPKNVYEYSKFDMVKLLTGEPAGVILKMEAERVVVLDTQGHQTSVNYFKIDSKIDDRRTVVQDLRGQDLTVGCTVMIKDGLYKEKVCTVKHIYKDSLFLFNSEMVHSSGMIVERCNNVCVITQNMSRRKNIKSSGTNNNAQDNKNDPNNKGPNAKKNQKDNLVGQTCTVRKGPWKGHQGIIKEADEKSVRLELTTKTKTLTLPRDHIDDGLESEFTKPASQNSLLQYARTPMIHGRDASSPAFDQSEGFYGSTGGFSHHVTSSPSFDTRK